MKKIFIVVLFLMAAVGFVSPKAAMAYNFGDRVGFLAVTSIDDVPVSIVQEKVIDTADFTDNARYGDDSPYGTGTPYGGDGNVHQFRLDLKRQKCQAIKIRIEEIQNDPENFGEGLTINNIMFEVGQKVGTNKVDTARKYGTE